MNSLTGLRFFAALMVFFFHTGLSINPIMPTEPAISPFADETVAQWYGWFFSNSGFVGVSIFFVLSGFVLAWSVGPDFSARAFIRRRLVKIFPSHVAMWALVMLLFAGGAVTWRVWLPNLLLLHSWFPDLQVSQSMNMPSWSLACELLFYLTFPFLVRPIARMSARTLWFGAAAMVAGLTLYQVLIATVLPSPPGMEGVILTNLQYWLSYLFPVGRMFEFLLGAFLAHIVLAGKWVRIPPLAAAAIMVLGYVATLFAPVPYSINLITLVPIGVLVASLADADMRGARTGMRGSVLVWFGKVSFGFYMCQAVTVFWLRGVTGGAAFSTPVAVLALLGLFAVTLLGGWCLYQFVEMPMMRRWSRKRPAPAAAPAPDAESPQTDASADSARLDERN
ncbi:acyltransferase [Nocardiopsis sp. YSL2]|uniref:acyltransferase family protein n=1 Tax=Nocardiopsis sp. YSL2 TaxID=2939492 RepID=UPI0026F47D2F|nr:acyltransferase [Nocardiopsis sp. YSL2]